MKEGKKMKGGRGNKVEKKLKESFEKDPPAVLMQKHKRTHIRSRHSLDMKNTDTSVTYDLALVH